MDWDRYVEIRLEEHNQELDKIARRIDELIGLKTEREIRIEEGYYRVMRSMRLVALETGGEVSGAKPPVLEHAISDWDFSSAGWTLDTTTYTSPPSSIKLTANCIALCKVSGTTDIVNGMIVSRVKLYYNWGYGTNVNPSFAFRREINIGSSENWGYGYTLLIGSYSMKANLYYYETTSLTRNYIVDLINKPADATAWNMYRVTWWTDPGGAGLIVRLEYRSGDQWIKMINDLNDPYNNRSTPGLRRCGIGSPLLYATMWFDDTEIWKAM